jgi:hypothetical protein
VPPGFPDHELRVRDEPKRGSRMRGGNVSSIEVNGRCDRLDPCPLTRPRTDCVRGVADPLVREGGALRYVWGSTFWVDSSLGSAFVWVGLGVWR